MPPILGILCCAMAAVVFLILLKLMWETKQAWVGRAKPDPARSHELAQVARHLHLRYQNGVRARTLNYPPFHQGSQCYPLGTLTGAWRDFPVQLGDYHAGDETIDPQTVPARPAFFSYCHLRFPGVRFPELRVIPKTAAACRAGALRADGKSLATHLNAMDEVDTLPAIAFELAAFERAYTVKSADRKFAYDCLCQPLLEYLVHDRSLYLHLDRHGLLIMTAAENAWPADSFEIMLTVGLDITRLIPAFVWEMHRD